MERWSVAVKHGRQGSDCASAETQRAFIPEIVDWANVTGSTRIERMQRQGKASKGGDSTPHTGGSRLVTEGFVGYRWCVKQVSDAREK